MMLLLVLWAVVAWASVGGIERSYPVVARDFPGVGVLTYSRSQITLFLVWPEQVCRAAWDWVVNAEARAQVVELDLTAEKADVSFLLIAKYLVKNDWVTRIKESLGLGTLIYLGEGAVSDFYRSGEWGYDCLTGAG